MRYLVYLLLICSFKQVSLGQSQGVTNSQTKLRPNQLRWSPTDATLDSVYIIRADTATGEPGWYLVTLGGSGNADTTLAGDVVGGLNSTFVRKINGVTVENKTPQGREVLQYDGTQWTPDSIDLADLPQMNASRVLGRGSSSAGVVTQLTPSNGVKISGNYIESDLTAGTGINISGTTTLTVSNSAPDQTVTISGATGTYPNFTVTPTAPGGATKQVQYNNAGVFGANDSIVMTSNPDRLGIGVLTPSARIDIQGSGATSATSSLIVQNSAANKALEIKNNNTLFGYTTSDQLVLALGNITTGAYGVGTRNNQFTFGALDVGTGSGLRILGRSTGMSYIDGYTEGASKAQNYDIIIGSRVNNVGQTITGNTTAEVGSNVQIGFETTTNPRALLSLNSTTRGFLPTRMTTTQRDAVTWVAGDEGMIIFNTTTKKHQGWDGTTWNDFY